ncbi:MAG TPA: ABC transporter ATP-binding protein [Candidatus Saccharimonadales bacterium]|nr:ABC transporter ATP-binding protein [Candidatus Saccharimonadales bacterium]
MDQNQRLYRAIEEGVSKGVPMDFIAYSLARAGWPHQVVEEGITQWRQANGREQKSTVFKDWLQKYYAQAKPAMFLMVVLNTISSAISLLQPWPTALLANSVFGNTPAPGPLRPYTHTPTLILFVALMTLAIFVVGYIFNTFKDFTLLKVGYWLNRSIKEESFRHILHLPLYHDTRLPKGDYIYRQNEVTNSLSDLVLNSTSEIIGSVILVIGVIGIMAVINAELTLVTIVVIPFLIVSIRFFGPIMAKWGQAMVILQSDSSTLISESIDNTESVQAFGLQERQVQRLKSLWVQVYDVASHGLLWNKAFGFTNQLFVILGTSIVIYFGGTQALEHHFTLGALLVFMTYMGYVTGPIQDITTQITVRRQKLVNVRRVYEVLSDHEGIEYVRRDRRLPPIQGRIDFQNVSLRHGDTEILKQASFTVMPKEKVGIIGPSGSGKTTILRLLDLFLEPEAGRVLLDGIDIQSVSLEDLRRNIAWISQSPELFAESIIDNMRDGDITRNITPEEIAWATQASSLSEFVGHLPMGLDTKVSENSASLSGGQKQRISIARALLKQAPVICMDEPTSALDIKSEKLILNSIGELIENKTVLLATHRLPLLRLMDTIYVMDGMRLVNVDNYGGVEHYVTQMERLGNI